jgi:hypothetical protein
MRPSASSCLAIGGQVEPCAAHGASAGNLSKDRPDQINRVVFDVVVNYMIDTGVDIQRHIQVERIFSTISTRIIIAGRAINLVLSGIFSETLSSFVIPASPVWVRARRRTHSATDVQDRLSVR